MQSRSICPPGARLAVHRIHEVTAYLLSGTHDAVAFVELERLARVVYAEAVIGALDEMERLSERVATIARGGVINHTTAPQLNAAVKRLLVLAEEDP